MNPYIDNRNPLPSHRSRGGLSVVSLSVASLSVVPLAALALAIPLGPASAATIDVNTTDDELNADGDCSLREAVYAANTDTAIDACTAGSGQDTVNIPSGSYSLALTGGDEDGNQTGDLDISSAVILQGAPVGSSIIDGNASDRVIHILATGDAELHRLTIRNGRTEDAMDFTFDAPGAGGGIYNQGVLTLVDSSVRNNVTGAGGDDLDPGGNGGGGGGIYNAGTATVRRSTIIDNLTGPGGWAESWPGDGGWGGGISNSGTLLVEDSVITNNTTGQSGATFIGPPTGGARGGSGAGISSFGSLTVRNTVVTNNDIRSGAGGGSGGGIYAAGSSQRIENSLIARNGAGEGPEFGDGSGSGLYFNSSGTISNSTVTDNDDGTSAVACSGGALNIEHSTIVGNLDPGVYTFASGDIRLRSSIVAGNGTDCSGASILSFGYNLVGSGTGCPAGGTGDVTTVSATVLTTQLEALADNGGPTRTFALRDTSIAIDAGACTDIGGGQVITDQRGSARPSGAACDIGAYEYLITSEYGSLVAVTLEPPGINCPNGGQRIDIGFDINGNSVLETNEITATSFACYAVDDDLSLISTAVLPIGDLSCPDGGVQINVGLDNGDGGGTADDGVLQAGEIDSSSAVCNATNGSDGSDGSDGAASLVSPVSLPVGDAACPAGGFVLFSGLDNGDGGGVADDGVLQFGERDSSAVICNGIAPIPTLVVTSAEPPGANCAGGGVRIEAGPDLDDSGTLDTDEIDAVSFVCNGSDGTDGTDGTNALVEVSAVPVGDTNCEHGGQRVDTGLDTDGDGILADDEIDNTAFICQLRETSGCSVSGAGPTRGWWLWALLLIPLRLRSRRNSITEERH